MPGICRSFSLCVVLAVLAGCGRPPDPNDPAEVGVLQPQVLQRNLKWASDFVNERVSLREIDEAEGRRLLQKYAQELTSTIDMSKVAPNDAWRYGEVFRTAKRWKEAENAFEISAGISKNAKSGDRFVHDRLRLAEAKANLGKFDEAMALTRSTFDVPAQDKAPILMATLYEIAPAVVKAKGREVEIANLLMDATDQHRQVVVDLQTEAGAAFYTTRHVHLGKAWQMVFDLLNAANRPDLVQAAQNRKAAQQTRRI